MKAESLPQRLIGSVTSQLAQGDRVSLISLVAANLLPIFFALIFGWELGGVAMFYWWENIVIGGYAVLRILLAKQEFNVQKSGPPAKLFLIPFFCFHYFFFCLVHGIFLMVFLSTPDGFPGSMDSPLGDIDHQSRPGPLVIVPALLGIITRALSILPAGAFLSVVGLVASHGISFFRHYLGKREFEATSATREMFRPYGRIVLLQVCIIFGGIFTILVGSPLALVLLLMVVKTIVDAVVHIASHSGKSMLDQAGLAKFRPNVHDIE